MFTRCTPIIDMGFEAGFSKGEVFTGVAAVLMAEFASGFCDLVTCTLYPQGI